MTATLLDSWWQLARAAGEVTFHAPQVVRKRGARLAQPGFLSMEDWFEATRMITEKFEASAEAQAELWRYGVTLQQRAWVDLWRAALAGRPAAPITSAALRRASRESAVLMRRSLNPVRRRVKANARRLARRS